MHRNEPKKHLRERLDASLLKISLPPKGNPFGNPAKNLSTRIIEFESASLSTVLIIKLKQEMLISKLIKPHFFRGFKRGGASFAGGNS